MTKAEDLEPLLDAQQNHLALIMTESASTDAKALGIGAADIAVLIFIAQAHLDFSGWLIHAALLIPFILSLACTIAAILPWKYLGPGVDTDNNPEYLTMDKAAMVKQLLVNTQTAIRVNGRINRLRWHLCTVSLLLAATGTCVLFVIL